MLVAKDDIEGMRAMMMLAEHYAGYISPTPTTPLVEETEEQKPSLPTEHPVLAELREAVTRLRSAMESADNEDFALGVETGMQRAADIIERIVERYTNGG